MLQKNEHYNKHLQSSWNENLIFEIIELTSEK